MTEPACAPPRSAALRDPVLLTLAGFALLGTGWYLSGRGTPTAQVLGYRLGQPVLNLALCVLAQRAARLPALPAATRRFWYAMSVAGAAFFIGNGFQALQALRHPGVDAASMGGVQSAFQLVGTLCPLALMLVHPMGLDTRRKRIGFWLDAATVLVGTAVVAWYFSVSTATDTEHLLAALATCGVSLVAVFAVAKLLISGSAPFTRPAALVGAASVGIEGLAEALNPVLLHTPRLHLLLAVSALPAFLSAATPRVQELKVRTDLGALTRRRRPYSRLPYLAVALTDALLVAALVDGGVDRRMWGVLAGVLVSTAMVVLRQLSAFKDNSLLLSRLDASLLEVTRHEQRFRSLVQHASEITVILTPDGLISYASPALERVTGLTPDAALGRHHARYVHPDDRPELRWAVGQLRAGIRTSVTTQVRVAHVDGGWRWLDVVSTNLIDDPSVAGVVCNARDVSEARRFQDQLRHDASHDPLTQLANRALFNDRVRQCAGRTAAILLIDLDHFKEVNDTLGHHVGDALLVATADRLRARVRPDDTVARLGGDEFAVLLPGAWQDDAARVAARIQASFAEPADCAGHALPIRASLGLAAGRLDDPTELVRQADAAMYATKRARKGTPARTA